MNERQAYALAHPLARADGSHDQLRPLLGSRVHKTGIWLKSILAVDR